METEMRLQTRETTIKLKTHHHEVKFIEDLKIEGGEGVLCPGCEELLSGRGFKCPVCDFLCHESCGLLKDKIRHPLHPDHSLQLFLPTRYAYCDACGKSCHRCWSYSCTECNFWLDIKCFSRWRVKKNTCDNHAFIPLVEQIAFTCNFCGEEGKGKGCICSVCLLMIHSKCGQFSRTIKISDHPDSLTLTYSAHKVEEHEKQEEEEQADIVCKLCSENVNTKYASYFCAECRYAVHLRCARDREVMEDRDVITGSLPIEYHGYVTHIIKDFNREFIKSRLAGTINHFGHQHELILNSEEVTIDKVCDGCMQLISAPFYSCVHCNFFLHCLCAKLPQNATYGGVPLNNTLLPQDDVFLCNFCGRYRHGFAYKREDNQFMMDLQCFIIQGKLVHEGHQHPLFALGAPRCNSCETRWGLLCSACNFSLCMRCATFPLAVSCKFDLHPLKMTYITKDDYGECYCFICEKKRNPKHWFYYCKTCDFSAHLQCVVGDYSYIKFGKIYKDKSHPRPLTFIQKTFESLPCDACDYNFDGVALHCKECKFNVHLYCLGEINKVRHVSSSC